MQQALRASVFLGLGGPNWPSTQNEGTCDDN